MGVAVSFDLFGTLVTVDRPEDPAAAVADELAARDVRVPSDWGDAYREPHVDAPAGAEVPLPAHVAAALSSRGVEPTDNAVRRAVVAAFDPDPDRRDGARRALRAAREHGPVGLLSNTSVPELARRSLLRADLRGTFDAVVTSVGCGWRKPDERAFVALERRLDAPVGVHVGDDPETDGGVTAVGGTFLDVREVGLAGVPAWLADRAGDAGVGERDAGGPRDDAGDGSTGVDGP